MTKNIVCGIINKSLKRNSPKDLYGGIAQLARALGSYPGCRWFKSNCRYQIWPVGQAAKTPPFHGGNMGSIPVRVTTGRSPEWLYKAVWEILFFSQTDFIRYLSAISFNWLGQGSGSLFFVLQKAECVIHSFGNSCLRILEHMTVDVKGRPTVAVP